MDGCVKYTKHFNKGFSLMEVLISLLIFSVGVLASGLMILKTLKLSQEGLLQTKATNLLQTQYEKIIATGALSNTSDWRQSVEAQLPQGKAFINQAPDERLVRMRIVWQGRNGKKELLELQFHLVA